MCDKKLKSIFFVYRIPGEDFDQLETYAKSKVRMNFYATKYTSWQVYLVPYLFIE